MGTAVSEEPRIAEIDISVPARALGVLRWSDYVLVVLCGYMALGILTEWITHGVSDAGSFAFEAVTLAVLGFAVWTGWRHLGTIDPRVWRAYRWVFPLLLGLAAFMLWSMVLAQNEQAGAGSDIDRATIAGFVMLGWVMVVILPAYLSLLLLPRMQLALVGTKLSTCLEALGRRGGDADALLGSLPRINPWRGRLFAGLGILVLVGVALVPEPADPKLAESTARVWPQLNLLGFFLLLHARRYFQVSADALLAADKRAPVLFLRSFDDDEKHAVQAADRAWLDFSLETRLANHFHRFGPFIAIGSPKETVPQLGAARVLLPDDQWQERVLGWMRDASVIVMYSGKTEWVNWELRKVVDNGRVGQLILLIPEIKGWRRGKKKLDLQARVEQLRGVFKGTPWAEELEAWRDFDKLRAMLFRADGSMVMIKSRSKSRDAYHLAALVSHHLLLTPKQLAELPAAALRRAA